MERKYTYEKLLETEEWKKRREEILTLAKYQCEYCTLMGLTTKNNLHVHHNQYREDIKPWEYSDEELICLCDSCHNFQHDIESRFRDALNLKKAFEDDFEKARADEFIIAFFDNFYVGNNGKIYPRFSDYELGMILDNRIKYDANFNMRRAG